MSFAAVRIGKQADEETLDAYCGRIARRIEEDLVPYLHDIYEVTTTPEPYLAYCIMEPDVPARTFLEARRQEVTGLLASDSRPDDISEEEVEDTWRTWFTYDKDDLVVVESDAALVIEPSGRYEDVLAVVEVANLQLLELRTFDAYLDRVVDRAYDDLDALFGRGLLRSGREMEKELSNVRMDFAEVTDEVVNITKCFGEWYLGKVYMGCARKFDLDSWRRVVTEKMKA